MRIWNSYDITTPNEQIVSDSGHNTLSASPDSSLRSSTFTPARLQNGPQCTAAAGAELTAMPFLWLDSFLQL